MPRSSVRTFGFIYLFVVVKHGSVPFCGIRKKEEKVADTFSAEFGDEIERAEAQEEPYGAVNCRSFLFEQ